MVDVEQLMQFLKNDTLNRDDVTSQMLNLLKNFTAYQKIQELLEQTSKQKK